ncbi:NAD-P-binding protein [Mycena epipterygia]|nr:NAD-P-binding protein [Mycena epipterygia]
MAWPWVVGPLISLLLLPYLYIRLNDRRLTHIPKSALAFSPVRYTVEDVRKTTARLLESPISTADQIPPKTGRRYIIVGGAGFVGGWIVLQLLERGEDPKRIRVVDIRAPVRPDLTTGLAKNVDFIQADVTDPAAVDAAFNAPWPNDASPVSAAPQISIFHTVANIRAYERSESLLVNSTKVNVVGTHNIIDAARNVGATALVCTSSGSVSVRSTRFLLWPWETEPKLFVQAINDDEALIPKRHYDFFSNYAVSKIAAEREVCAADKTPSRDGKVLRTGCVRPANGIFGPGGDTICGDYLVRKVNPSWIHSMVGNFIYVENAALAHLLYEQRLIELSNGGTNPDIGGQAFIVTDPNPPPTNGDVYLTLSTLTDGETKFPWLSPTFIIFLGYLIEWYYLARLSLGSRIAKKLPAITGDIVNLQPALFNLVNVHLFFDDSRARLAPEKGGLGYKGAWSTFEGVHKTVDEYKAAVLRSETKAFRRHLV